MQTCGLALVVAFGQAPAGAPSAGLGLLDAVRTGWVVLTSLLFASFLLSTLEQIAQARAVSELQGEYARMLEAS